jgi:N-formylglutamate amidohydrolase
MINPLVVAEAESGDDPAFTVDLPPSNRAVGPLVFASPHSGRIYPDAFMAATELDAHAIRGSEDAFVDRLIETAPGHGIPVIGARFARAYIDVNREPWELDPRMFEDELPSFARGRGARVSAGLGAIARIVREGQEIYARKLTFAEAAARVNAVHAPYHVALSALIERAKAAAGLAILLDWHSMPREATAASCPGGAPDIVLGDRFGASCSPSIARRVEREIAALGYRVVRNAPYAGGYTTEHYGRPRSGAHALQIEISRALYLDERNLTPSAGYAALHRDLGRLFAALAAVDWTGL